MTLYRLDTMKRSDPEHCFLHAYPDGMGLKSHKLCRGLEVAEGEYPHPAFILMSEREPGLEAPDIVGNSCNLLIVSRRLKEAIEAFGPANVQYLPLEIRNPRGRPVSKEHFIANPLGTCDVLDRQASTIVWNGEKVVEVQRYVLDAEKERSAPPLFRIKENPEAYVIHQGLLDHLRRVLVPKPTNVSFFRIEPPTA